MSRYTWLLDPGHGGIIDGVYQTAGKRSPIFPDGSVLYEGEFNRSVVKHLLKFCQKGNVEAIDIVDSLEDIPGKKETVFISLFTLMVLGMEKISIMLRGFAPFIIINPLPGRC